MARVDAGDDDLLRYIVRHYRYDETRRERRHVELAAYDDPAEFESTIAQAAAALAERNTDGFASTRRSTSAV